MKKDEEVYKIARELSEEYYKKMVAMSSVNNNLGSLKKHFLITLDHTPDRDAALVDAEIELENLHWELQNLKKRIKTQAGKKCVT